MGSSRICLAIESVCFSLAGLSCTSCVCVLNA
jgi:hypothetical protein